MADIESSEVYEEDDDDTNLHNKTLDIECVVIDENDEAAIKASETESQEVEGNNLVVNALSGLRAPRKSELARKRRVKVNQQKQGTRNVRAKTSTAPKVSALARIREFPDEHFKDTATDKGSIFCEACREEISVKRSTILNHI